MCRLLSCFLSTALLVVVWSSSCDTSGECGVPAQVLLQSHKKISAHANQQSEFQWKFGNGMSLGTNPSGAAAPLDETGYSAVADRCCQAEMIQFMERAALDLNLEICEQGGLYGLVPFHSCEKGPQTYAELTSTLLESSTERCKWVAATGTCAPIPADCPDFSGTPPAADCSCSRSKAASVNFAAATISSNLGGLGPDTSAPAELRYGNVGTSDTGVTFDLVVTNLTTYNSGNSPQLNGISTGFGCITTACQDPPTTFKFSFMEPGTNTPVQLSEIHMALFDLDGIASKGVEIASSKGYRGYVTDATPSVVASRLDDGRTKFSSSQAVDNIPNPTDPNSLTTEQRQNSVMYFYVDVTSFELTFGIETCVYARNLFFAGTSVLNDRCGE